MDVFYLATYPLVRGRAADLHPVAASAGRDRRSLLDALTLTVGLTLLSWMYLILPYVHNPALSWQQKAVAIAYPLGDAPVLAMLAQLLAPGDLADPVRPAAHGGQRSACSPRTSLFGIAPAVRHVPRRRPLTDLGLGGVLRRLGRGRAAPEHDRR